MRSNRCLLLPCVSRAVVGTPQSWRYQLLTARSESAPLTPSSALRTLILLYPDYNLDTMVTERLVNRVAGQSPLLKPDECLTMMQYLLQLPRSWNLQNVQATPTAAAPARGAHDHDFPCLDITNTNEAGVSSLTPVFHTLTSCAWASLCLLTDPSHNQCDSGARGPQRWAATLPHRCAVLLAFLSSHFMLATTVSDYFARLVLPRALQLFFDECDGKQRDGSLFTAWAWSALLRYGSWLPSEALTRIPLEAALIDKCIVGRHDYNVLWQMHHLATYVQAQPIVRVEQDTAGLVVAGSVAWLLPLTAHAVALYEKVLQRHVDKAPDALISVVGITHQLLLQWAAESYGENRSEVESHVRGILVRLLTLADSSAEAENNMMEALRRKGMWVRVFGITEWLRASGGADADWAKLPNQLARSVVYRLLRNGLLRILPHRKKSHEVVCHERCSHWFLTSFLCAWEDWTPQLSAEQVDGLMQLVGKSSSYYFHRQPTAATRGRHLSEAVLVPSLQRAWAMCMDAEAGAPDTLPLLCSLVTCMERTIIRGGRDGQPCCGPESPPLAFPTAMWARLLNQGLLAGVVRAYPKRYDEYGNPFMPALIAFASTFGGLFEAMHHQHHSYGDGDEGEYAPVDISLWVRAGCGSISRVLQLACERSPQMHRLHFGQFFAGNLNEVCVVALGHTFQSLWGSTTKSLLHEDKHGRRQHHCDVSALPFMICVYGLPCAQSLVVSDVGSAFLHQRISTCFRDRSVWKPGFEAIIPLIFGCDTLPGEYLRREDMHCAHVLSCVLANRLANMKGSDATSLRPLVLVKTLPEDYRGYAHVCPEGRLSTARCCWCIESLWHDLCEFFAIFQHALTSVWQERGDFIDSSGGPEMDELQCRQAVQGHVIELLGTDAQHIQSFLDTRDDISDSVHAYVILSLLMRFPVASFATQPVEGTMLQLWRAAFLGCDSASAYTARQIDELTVWRCAIELGAKVEKLQREMCGAAISLSSASRASSLPIHDEDPVQLLHRALRRRDSEYHGAPSSGGFQFSDASLTLAEALLGATGVFGVIQGLEAVSPSFSDDCRHLAEHAVRVAADLAD